MGFFCLFFKGNLEFPLSVCQERALSCFPSCLSFLPQILDQFPTYALHLERSWFSIGLSIYCRSFSITRYLNQKLSEQHGQGQSYIIQVLESNLTFTPCSSCVFCMLDRQARQSLLLFLREYGNSHSLPPSNFLSLSHSNSLARSVTDSHNLLFILFSVIVLYRLE